MTVLVREAKPLHVDFAFRLSDSWIRRAAFSNDTAPSLSSFLYSSILLLVYRFVFVLQLDSLLPSITFLRPWLLSLDFWPVDSYLPSYSCISIGTGEDARGCDDRAFDAILRPFPARSSCVCPIPFYPRTTRPSVASSLPQRSSGFLGRPSLYPWEQLCDRPANLYPQATRHGHSDQKGVQRREGPR